jgi:hypothetical protein
MFRVDYHSGGRSQKVSDFSNAVEAFHIMAGVVAHEA